MRTYFDTNILIAAALENHPMNGLAGELLKPVHSGKTEGWVSGHGLAEFYAVLTRAPLSPPVHPSEAWQILERSILPHFKIVALAAKEYRQVLQHAARAGWSGGRIYDALHVAAARKAKCSRMATFNRKHFLELAPDLL